MHCTPKRLSEVHSNDTQVHLWFTSIHNFRVIFIIVTRLSHTSNWNRFLCNVCICVAVYAPKTKILSTRNIVIKATTSRWVSLNCHILCGCVCVCDLMWKMFFTLKRGANTMNNFVCISCDDIHNTDPFQSFVWHKLCSPLAASNPIHTLWLPNHIVTSWLASMLVWFVLFVLYPSPDHDTHTHTNCDTLQARAICCFPIRWTRLKPICNRAICASYRQPNFYSKLKA